MNVISLNVENRTENVPEIQEILTKYGENIESRIGLHNIGKEKRGLILIIYNSDENVEDFVEELNTIKDVNVNCMKI